MKTELTLAVATKDVWQNIDYQENAVIRITDVDVMGKLLSKGVFRHRNELENDSNFKQIIPYAIICHGDMVYVFKRTNKQTEERLHNLQSLGVGGHMNPWGNSVDIAYLHHELKREMNEEVLLYSDCKVEKLLPIGFINDDTNEVGKVHLGVLYEITLSNTNIEINEKEKMTGRWVLKQDLKDIYPYMESWSKLYYDLISMK